MAEAAGPFAKSGSHPVNRSKYAVDVWPLKMNLMIIPERSTGTAEPATVKGKITRK